MGIKAVAIAAAFVLGSLCPLAWFAARPKPGNVVFAILSAQLTDKTVRRLVL